MLRRVVSQKSSHRATVQVRAVVCSHDWAKTSSSARCAAAFEGYPPRRTAVRPPLLPVWPKNRPDRPP